MVAVSVAWAAWLVGRVLAWAIANPCLHGDGTGHCHGVALFMFLLLTVLQLSAHRV